MTLGTKPFNGTQLCKEYDPDLFFPDVEDPSYNYIANRAKSICKECPLINPCLEYALTDSSLLGIWGGTDEQQQIGRAHV